MRKINLPPTIWLVLTGILFNVISALITHYFVGLNDDRIAELDRQIDRQKLLIDSLWQTKTEIERKQEFFTLLLDRSDTLSKPVLEQFQNHLQDMAEKHRLSGFKPPVVPGFTSLHEISSAARQATIESINDTYLQSLELEQKKHPLIRSNSRLISIAIFLQVTGLILVLARDFRSN